MANTYASLISGSDLRGHFTALTPEAARLAARAFARMLSEQLHKPASSLRLAAGRDSRLSGPALLAAVLSGFADEGASVIDCGLATTPAMFAACTRHETQADGAVMVTASHLPADRNGLKFFTRQGGLSHADIAALTDAMASPNAFDAPAAPYKTPLRAEFVKIYAETLRGMLRVATGEPRPLSGMRVVLDASNGAGGFFAQQVLVPLGADIEGSIGLEPDGCFPLHQPNPEDATALAALCGASRAAGAHLGILFDADVDRVAFCDAHGAPIARNRLIALCAALTLRRHPASAIVTDSATSIGLGRFIASLGGTHVRHKRGYHNVIAEARRLGAPLAIETSGHAAFADNAFLDDGAYLACRLLASEVLMRREGGSLLRLIEGFAEPPETREARMPVTPEEGARLVAALVACPRGLAAADERDGARLLLEVGGGYNAFVSARFSVHDPVLVVCAQSEVPGGIDAARLVLESIGGMPPL